MPTTDWLRGSDRIDIHAMTWRWPAEEDSHARDVFTVYSMRLTGTKARDHVRVGQSRMCLGEKRVWVWQGSPAELVSIIETASQLKGRVLLTFPNSLQLDAGCFYGHKELDHLTGHQRAVSMPPEAKFQLFREAFLAYLLDQS